MTGAAYEMRFGRIRQVILAGLALMVSPLAFAAACPVVHHNAPSAADTAYLAGDFTKAADLYKAELTANADQTGSMQGLIHSLLRQQKVIESADNVQTLIASKPASAALLTLRGEVELREGEPWTAATTAVAALKLDPCNPRAIFLYSRLAALDSRNITSRKFLNLAHQLDPEDPEIRAAWLETLPAAARIPQLESYLSAPRGDDAETADNRKAELEDLKKWVSVPQPSCTLVSKGTSAEIPFTEIRSVRGNSGFDALDINVNNQRVRLSIDTGYNAHLPIDGFSGLLIQKSAARKMDLKPVYDNMIPGIGPQGYRNGSIAIADSIMIGDVEYHNCAVQILDGQYWNDADGSISMTLFSDFLVSLNFPDHKLKLSKLPDLPASNAVNGITERFISPEMKDYTPIYRSGADLILPVSINRKYMKLMLIDTAIGFSSLSPEAAHEIGDGRKDPKYEVRDTNGIPMTLFSAGDAQLTFAGMTQSVNHIITFDTARFTRDAGTAISGLIAEATLKLLTVHIDYRDGLVKMEYGAQHSNKH